MMWRRVTAIAILTSAAALLAYWYFRVRVPPIPQRTLRIGFENNPPLQIRTADGGFAGLAVETVSVAAKRAGIKLQWVETGASSEESLRKHLVDLWPLMVDLPLRRKFAHFSRPYMHNTYVLMSRADSAAPDRDFKRDFKGSIAYFDLPLHVHLLQSLFPEARLVPLHSLDELSQQVCEGEVDAALFDSRGVVIPLRDQLSANCDYSSLRLRRIPDSEYAAGVASTFEAAGASDRIQREIDDMFRDGTLTVLIAKYSYFGLDDAWASYEVIESANRTRWLAWTISFIVLALGLGLWQASALRMRKRSESALRESEQRFRSLANTAPVMIVASGADGRATFFNKVWLDFTGRTMEQELGDKWLDDVHPDDRDNTVADYSASLAARTKCDVEYRLRRPDGEYRQILCSGVPRFEVDGTFGGYIASCVDLTDIRRSQEEAQARHNLESLGVLAGGIAHDFNNLLGGALSYSELAQAKLDVGAKPDEELRQIRNLAVRGSEIVRQLMIFAGKETGSFESVDVCAVVIEMLELLKVSISKHAVLKTSLSKDLPLVLGIAPQVRQVVMNLVTNASEAIGERDGVIDISATCLRIEEGSGTAGAENLAPGEYVELRISDTGGGMSPETQSRLFEPFFSTKFAGRGMGLAVVHRIVQRHRGSIHLVSALGEGTSVRVKLPCAPATVEAGRPDTAQETRVTPVPIRFDVLVVEDESALRIAVSKMLRRKGFGVIEASDGTAALDLIRLGENQIDAMLLDVTLPGASSREVFEEAQRLRPGLQVILTSAYSKETVEITFPGIGPANFIRKPFHIADLLNLFEEPSVDDPYPLRGN